MKCDLSEIDKKFPVEHFYKIPSKNEQDLFLQGLIIKEHCKTHRPCNKSTILLLYSFKSFCLLGSDRKEVCKNAYLKIYGVTERRV